MYKIRERKDKLCDKWEGVTSALLFVGLRDHSPIGDLRSNYIPPRPDDLDMESSITMRPIESN